MISEPNPARFERPSKQAHKPAKLLMTACMMALADRRNFTVDSDKKEAKVVIEANFDSLSVFYEIDKGDRAGAAAAMQREMSLEAIRASVADRVERSSLRQLAADVGVNHGTLHHFINGATPQRRVRRALAEWYVRQMAASPGSYPPEAYAAALEVLLAALPPDVRDHAAADLLDAIERLHASVGAQPPEWLARLRESIRGNLDAGQE